MLKKFRPLGWSVHPTIPTYLDESESFIELIYNLMKLINDLGQEWNLLIDRFIEIEKEWSDMKISWEEFQIKINDEWEAYQIKMNGEWEAYQIKMNGEWEVYKRDMSTLWDNFKLIIEENQREFINTINNDWTSYQTALNLSWNNYKISTNADLNNFKNEYIEKFNILNESVIDSFGSLETELKTSINLSFEQYKNETTSFIQNEVNKIPNRVDEKVTEHINSGNLPIINSYGVNLSQDLILIPADSSKSIPGNVTLFLTGFYGLKSVWVNINKVTPSDSDITYNTIRDGDYTGEILFTWNNSLENDGYIELELSVTINEIDLTKDVYITKRLPFALVKSGSGGSGGESVVNKIKIIPDIIGHNFIINKYTNKIESDIRENDLFYKTYNSPSEPNIESAKYFKNKSMGTGGGVDEVNAMGFYENSLLQNNTLYYNLDKKIEYNQFMRLGGNIIIDGNNGIFSTSKSFTTNDIDNVNGYVNKSNVGMSSMPINLICHLKNGMILSPHSIIFSEDLDNPFLPSGTMARFNDAGQFYFAFNLEIEMDKVDYIEIVQNISTPFQCQEECNYITFKNCVFDSFYLNFAMQYVKNLNFIDCEFINFSNLGVQQYDNSTTNFYNCKFNGMYNRDGIYSKFSIISNDINFINCDFNNTSIFFENSAMGLRNTIYENCVLLDTTIKYQKGSATGDNIIMVNSNIFTTKFRNSDSPQQNAIFSFSNYANYTGVKPILLNCNFTSTLYNYLFDSTANIHSYNCGYFRYNGSNKVYTFEELI